MVPNLTTSLISVKADAPTLIVGPSLGTAVEPLWVLTAEKISSHFQVIGWDLPGHGRSEPAGERFSVAELASAVATLVRKQRTLGTIPWHQPIYYAGISLGGAVGLQLALDAGDLFAGIAIICSAAKIGDFDNWTERAEKVSALGTSAVVDISAKRWFSPGFTETHADVSTALLNSLKSAEPISYAHCCEALAEFDVREQLCQIAVPVVAIAGENDLVCPPERAKEIAEKTQRGHWETIDSAAHLASVEAPDVLASILVKILGTTESTLNVTSAFITGMTVRREVLGNSHVDRATAVCSDFTKDFQEFITCYAWGTVWSRKGLSRKTRSAITLTALIAGAHWEELEMHINAALRNGMTIEEIREVFLQSAIYCSVPAANRAFAIGQRVISEWTAD